MHAHYAILAVAALVLDFAFAQPAHHRHKRLHRLDLAGVLHGKRQNWNDPSLYAGVNWNAVNYGNAGAAPAPAPAPSPKPAPAPAPAPATPKKQAVAPVPAPAPATNSNPQTGSGKRGLAYNPSSPNLDIFDSYGKITWGYNWESSPQGLPSKYQYVAMCWSGSVDENKWKNDAKAATSGSGTHYLMSFNEPDMKAQANMNVGPAVAAFNRLMTPLASGNVKLGSPAVTNGAGVSQDTGFKLGLDWLGDFFQQCSDCPIDFVPIHWYGSDAADFKAHTQKAMNAAVVNGQKKPVWVTEFQCLGQDQGAFLADVLPWLDSQSQVERYSYFMASGVSLTNGNGVSALGQKYAST